jgi:ligand-binding sensor domain-containing protein
MVRSIFTDSRGKVWIGTSNGLACYDDHTNSFHSFFKDRDNENSLPSNWVTVISEDAVAFCGSALHQVFALLI